MVKSLIKKPENLNIKMINYRVTYNYWWTDTMKFYFNRLNFKSISSILS